MPHFSQALQNGLHLSPTYDVNFFASCCTSRLPLQSCEAVFAQVECYTFTLIRLARRLVNESTQRGIDSNAMSHLAIHHLTFPVSPVPHSLLRCCASRCTKSHAIDSMLSHYALCHSAKSKDDRLGNFARPVSGAQSDSQLNSNPACTSKAQMWPGRIFSERRFRHPGGSAYVILRKEGSMVS